VPVIYVGVVFGGGYRSASWPVPGGGVKSHSLERTSEQLQTPAFIGWLERFLVVTALLLAVTGNGWPDLTQNPSPAIRSSKIRALRGILLIGTLLASRLALLGSASGEAYFRPRAILG